MAIIIIPFKVDTSFLAPSQFFVEDYGESLRKKIATVHCWETVAGPINQGYKKTRIANNA